MPVWTWAASVAVHGVVVGAIGWLTYFHLKPNDETHFIPNERRRAL